MSPQPPADVNPTVRTVFRLAALFTLLAVAMGSLVCATESGAACPTWPGCYASGVLPGWQLNPVIEFAHRIIAIAAGPLVLAAAIMSRRAPRNDPRIRLLPWVAVAGAAAAAIFGRLVVLTGLPKAWGVVDLSCALIAMIAMTVATVALERGGQPRVVTPTSRLAWTAIGALIAMHLLGIVVSGQSSYTRCIGWPVTLVAATDLHPALQSTRVILGLVVVITIVLITRRTVQVPAQRPLGLALISLLLLEGVFGVMIRTLGLNAVLAAGFSLTAVTLLWCLGLTAARTEAIAGSGLPRLRSTRPATRI